MLVSSTSMNAATATTTPISQGLNLGRQVADASETGALAVVVAPGGGCSRLAALSVIGSSYESLAWNRNIYFEDSIRHASEKLLKNYRAICRVGTWRRSFGEPGSPPCIPYNSIPYVYS